MLNDCIWIVHACVSSDIGKSPRQSHNVDRKKNAGFSTPFCEEGDLSSGSKRGNVEFQLPSRQMQGQDGQNEGWITQCPQLYPDWVNAQAEVVPQVAGRKAKMEPLQIGIHHPLTNPPKSVKAERV